MKKYKLGEAVFSFGIRILHRIVAVRDFGDVKIGDVGGWIESEDNLSHEGKCWIYDNARVYGNARVEEDAIIYNEAEIGENARISGGAQIYDSAKVLGEAQVHEHAQVFDKARVFDAAIVCGYSEISERGVVRDHAKVYRGQIYGDGEAGGFARVSGGKEVTTKIIY